MYNRILQFLSICYRYNKHYNTNRIWISVIGKKNAIIVYKQLVNNKYMIKGFDTNLDSSKVLGIIQYFYKHIPYNPEVCAAEFDTFTEFLHSYIENTDIDRII